MEPPVYGLFFQHSVGKSISSDSKKATVDYKRQGDIYT
jgi:hypothetical protein